ncbi:OmpA family protein [Reyranella sp.]|uniref:OmpA family protein n=1 Tax=Reyranella sp. TaxID=1929291 RepID=UPI0027319B80|nr:OmpA family protein [Reyranella sp.]MDP2376428.1 OmpA family protein [Reyranella sp.]
MKKALIVAAMLAAGPAMAQTQDDYVPYQGFYIGAGGGAVWALSSNPGVTTYTGWVAGGKIGYDFIGPRLDLEVGYGEIGNNVFFPGSAVSGKTGQLNVMGNVYYDFMAQERFNPYIGAGLGVAFIDSNTALGSTQFAWQAMVGARYNITSSLSVGLEGRYMGTTNPSINTPTGTVYSQNQTIAALAGIAFKFGAPPSAPPPPPPPAVAPPSFMVFFDWDRSNLSAQALNTIKQAADAYKTKGNARITATGHTDTSGPETYNMALSLRRANTVKDALVQNGVPAPAIAVIGRGEQGLLVQTGDGVREPQNRRVEIVIQ